MIILFFLLFYKKPANVYISLENPKQGDTVFIRVKSESNNVTGNFIGQDLNEKLVFLKKGLPAQAGNSQDWISFLGIDADQKPGDYKINIDIGGNQKLTKEIKVTEADFSLAPTAPPPDLKQKEYTEEKAVNNIIKNDNPALKKILSNFTEKPYFTGQFFFPLSKVEEKGFSFGKFIKFAKYKIQHLGVDLKAPEKTEIYSVNDGKIVAVFNLSNYGKTVIIDHGLNIFSLYLHLEEFKVSVGQMVRRSQIIGLSGDTGYTTAPHLHFSMRVGNSRINPIVFIEASQKIYDNPILVPVNAALINVVNSFK
ncbi:MAG: M23 family metallopeptidase [Patescibacteria group bacterium]